MTNPELYIEGNDGHYRNWWFDGQDGLRDSGPSNLFENRVACVLDDTPFVVSGTDAAAIPLQDPPVMASTGTIADSAINTGVTGLEWTGTGTSEQLDIGINDYVFTYGENGQQFEAGAWVYTEAVAAIDVSFRIVFYDDVSTNIHTDTAVVTVQPEEWTYLSVVSAINSTDESNSTRAYLLIEGNGNQSVGDKIYVGAAALGPGVSSGWTFPTTPSNDILDFRFTAKINGDGVVYSNRTGESTASDGDSYHIEAVNKGFHVQTGTRASNSVFSGRTYTTATDIYEYGVWYNFRWTYEPSTGQHKFYVLRSGRWDVIDSGTVTTTTDNLSTAYGISTLSSGLSAGVGGSHMLIDTFGLFDGDEFGWRISEDNAEDIIGSALDIPVDAVTPQYDNSLYLDQSGWIIDAAGSGGLQLPYRSELKYGTGDFTIVQTVTAVADEDFRPSYDDFVTNTGVMMRVDAGVFGVLVGPDSMNFPSNPFDGGAHLLMVERESGVEIRGYLDDPNASVVTAADTGTDISNTEPLNLGFDDLTTGSSFLSGLIGLTLTFDRLLEEFERDDLEAWISDGYPVENEPDWLRQEAVLYINPNDSVQQEEYKRASSILNLAIQHPDTLYVRYVFTSDDGVSNPQLTDNKLSIDNRGGELDVSDIEFDRSISGFVVDWHELGADWLNNNWAISWWMEQGESTAEQHVFGQVDTDNWYVRVDNTDDIVFVVNGAVELTAAGVLTEYLQMCTLTYDGANLTLFIDDTQVAQTGAIASSSPQVDLEYGVLGSGANEFTGRLGPLLIVKEAFNLAHVSALFDATGLAKSPVMNETYTLSDSFDDISLNWGRL